MTLRPYNEVSVQNIACFRKSGLLKGTQLLINAIYLLKKLGKTILSLTVVEEVREYKLVPDRCKSWSLTVIYDMGF